MISPAATGANAKVICLTWLEALLGGSQALLHCRYPPIVPIFSIIIPRAPFSKLWNWRLHPQTIKHPADLFQFPDEWAIEWNIMQLLGVHFFADSVA